MLEGSNGIVYLTAIEENAIARFEPRSRNTMVVVQDKRLQWPDTMAWGRMASFTSRRRRSIGCPNTMRGGASSRGLTWSIG
jgi:hypothetical protein